MKKKIKIIAAFIAAVILLENCSKQDQVTGTTELLTTPANFTALPLTVTAPADNQLTTQKIALGKLLFWDPLLSGKKDIACATCHHPALGFTDNLDLSIGVNGQGTGISRHFLLPNSIPFAKRNSMSIINTAFNGISASGTYDPLAAAMFFDNRVHSLELQSVEPIKTLEEMKGTAISSENILDSVLLRLKNIQQYTQLFNDVFGTSNAVSLPNLGKAIAGYERSVISNHSPYDEYIRGNKSAMTATQIRGMSTFVSSGCIKCHSGPMFSDYALHVLSVPDNPKLPADAGANGTYAFRTPSLRNLSLTAPYMHSGVFTSLNAVLDFYEQVGNHRSQNTHVGDNQLDENLQRINDRDKDEIIQFLSALNDPGFDKSIPPSVPSGLHPGGN